MMFTGIVETIGTIQSVRRSAHSLTVSIRPALQPFSVDEGGSVAVDGVCLTLEASAGDTLTFTAVAETLSRTTLAHAAAGARVNLERALRIDGRLGGHFVLGHIDGISRIITDRFQGEGIIRTFEAPRELGVFLAPKGSVTIDGVSLTIVDSSAGRFSVSLVPFTRNQTTAALKSAGDAVNMECDVLARYIFHMLKQGEGGGESRPDKIPSLGALLERSGF